jgi:Putative prokaryotic signal transducing protein
VRDEIEAEIVCSLLRENGIPCFYKRTDFSAGSFDRGPGMGGGREIWVNEEDVPRARELANPA